MQPKCTTAAPTPASTSQSSSNNNLHLPVERFKEICLRNGGENSKDITLILDHLFDPEKKLNSSKNDVEILKNYITGGESFESFKKKVKKYDTSSICGLVWNVSYVAYRCRTCASSPCMSICADCFKNSDHTGHDYNMFRSGAGGACDCGDECVMNPKGFCKFHGKRDTQNLKVPDDLIKCSEIILAHLLYRLIQFFRNAYASSNYNLGPTRLAINILLADIQPYLDMLNELCSFGTALRKVFVQYLIDESFYQRKIKEETEKISTTAKTTNTTTLSSTKSENIQNMNEIEQTDQVDEPIEEENSNSSSNYESSVFTYQHQIYMKAIGMEKPINVPVKFTHIADEIRKIIHKTMMDEFLFWCIHFEFPENLVKFLLSLLPDNEYKVTFIKSFVAQYSYISLLLLRSKSEHLSSRVVHISVQLFSNESIAAKAMEECYLLPIILSTLYNMIVTSNKGTPESNEEEDDTSASSNLLIKNILENEMTNRHFVVDPDHPVLQENLYWLVISDMVNLLSHRKVALTLMSDENLIDLWFELVSHFQSMNLNIRQFGEHVLQEQPTYFSSFSAELEFCSSIMWSYIQHLKSSADLHLSKQITVNLMHKLKEWLILIGLYYPSQQKIKRPNFKHLTFHLPLHRYLSTFLYNALYVQSGRLDDLFPENKYDAHFLMNLIAHPLQLQIGFHEIHANMWVRNGMAMKGQAMTYCQNHFSSSFNDSDLFLIQALVNKLDANTFMNCFFERFHLLEWLKSTIRSYNSPTSTSSTANKALTATTTGQTRAEGTTGMITADSDMINLIEEMLDEFNETSTNNNNNNNNNANNEDPNDRSNPDDLEPAHQVAMLIGSLTVLAQIITIKPNLRLKSYLLTRNEIVSLLCVSDRTFSQIEENMPDICSLSSAKKFIQPILSHVADYIQPSLDAIGNLKQGRYKPKDNIWLNEYDPLYVMMRSVKRREFQESFDRYTQFVEKKLTVGTSSSKMAKSVWPPFRLPRTSFQNIRQNLDDIEPLLALNLNDSEYSLVEEIQNEMRVDNELSSLSNLLNTKILHSILLTILYQHHHVTPVNEKILYFVVYMLELAVYYASLNEKVQNDEEMPLDAAESKVQFDELNFETWFKSNEIGKNLCTYVRFTKLEQIASNRPTEASMSSDAQVVTEDDDVQLSSDASKQSVPPLKRIRSGGEEQEQSEAACSSQESTNLKSNNMRKTYNYESIISLLVKMVHANQTSDSKTSKAQPFQLAFMHDSANDECVASSSSTSLAFKYTRIGDETDFLLNLLEKIAKLDEKCRLNIEQTVQTINSVHHGPRLEVTEKFDMDKKLAQFKANQTEAVGEKSSPSDEELKNKKSKAKARQQKLLAQMSSSQKAFLANPNNKADIEALKEISVTDSARSPLPQTDVTETNAPTTSQLINSQDTIEPMQEPTEPEEVYDCCICRLTSSSTPERPIGVVTLLQPTSVLGYRESVKCSKNRKKLPLNDDVSYKDLITDTMCWKQEDKRIRTICEAFSLESCKYSINIGWKGGVYAQMCGHYLHFDCYNSYKQTLDEQTNLFTRSPNIEYTCPLCRQMANCVLPVAIPKSKLTTSSKPTPSQPQQQQQQAQPQTSLIQSTVTTTPAKIWLLSSLAEKNLSEPSDTAESDSIQHNLKDDYETIFNMLKSRRYQEPIVNSRVLTQCKNDALTIVTLTTPIEFRYIDHTSTLSNPSAYGITSPVDDDIVMFTTSVLRTQLEIDLMLKMHADFDQQPISLYNFKKKRACFLPLFDVISTHCRFMCDEQKPHLKQWLMLIDPTLSKNANEFLSLIRVKANKEDKLTQSAQIKQTLNVPVLLKDPISVLLLLVVNLPTTVEKNIFTFVVTNVFNALFMQNVIELCRELDDDEKAIWNYHKAGTDQYNWITLRDYIANTIDFFKKNSNLFNENKAPTDYMKTIWTWESIKNFIEMRCLHYLRIASVLQSYLYDSDLVSVNLNSFNDMVSYLNISFSFHMFSSNEPTADKSSSLVVESSNQDVTSLLKWMKSKETTTFWFDELLKARSSYEKQVDTLINLSFDRYHFPQLLDLPYLYADLFGYYLNKKCQFCSRVPRETAICLICGAQICYKTNYCCDSMRDFNRKHTNACGAGTLILININTTYIFIVRGKRFASWASLYLDEHGEEDRDLKRGKPLYLNYERYNLLTRSWLSHSFDYQNLKWHNTSMLTY